MGYDRWSEHFALCALPEHAGRCLTHHIAKDQIGERFRLELIEQFMPCVRLR